MKRLLALAGLAVLFAAPAFADVPGSEGVGNAPDCHGQNQVPCRPDPQPEHGNDCTRSDDHVCTTTTTSTSTTSTSAPAPSTTTTTTGPVSAPTTTTPSAPTTSTTTPVVPSTTATPEPASAAPAVSATPAPTTAPAELPRTGSDVRILLAMGMSVLLIGALLLKVAQ